MVDHRIRGNKIQFLSYFYNKKVKNFIKFYFVLVWLCNKPLTYRKVVGRVTLSVVPFCIHIYLFVFMYPKIVVNNKYIL